MAFLYVYIIFSILIFVVVVMQSYISAKEIKREYPDLVEVYCKNNKRNFLEKAFRWIKVFIVCFIPIINISIFYFTIFESESVKKQTKDKIFIGREREEQNDIP